MHFHRCGVEAFLERLPSERMKYSPSSNNSVHQIVDHWLRCVVLTKTTQLRGATVQCKAKTQHQSVGSTHTKCPRHAETACSSSRRGQLCTTRCSETTQTAAACDTITRQRTSLHLCMQRCLGGDILGSLSGTTLPTPCQSLTQCCHHVYAAL